MAEEIRLSKSFIETELPQAPPLYVSVYLMTLAVGQDAKKVAEKLKATETDVLYAWGYWKGKGYLQEEQRQEPQRPALTSSARPDYSPRELALYIKNDKVRKLFDSAQKKLGKMLSQQDMSLLFSFYDWLGLPMEVIELLLSYCTASGHTGMRYIEKVAIAGRRGVNTVEKAAEYIELRKTGYRSILQAFGQNRMPVAAEEAYMKKWLQEYKLPLDVVKLACERTVMQTGKASFAYADRILENWKKAGVSSVADVQAQDAAFAAKKAAEYTDRTDRRKATARTEAESFHQLYAERMGFCGAGEIGTGAERKMVKTDWGEKIGNENTDLQGGPAGI